MATKKKGNNLNKRKVSFSFYSPDAKAVSVVGDFNQWRPDAHPMRINAGGEWQKSVFLAPGTYEYKFKADDQWELDVQNPKICENSFGTQNNFIVVEKKV